MSVSTVSTLGTSDAVRLLDVSEGTAFDCAPVEDLGMDVVVGMSKFLLESAPSGTVVLRRSLGM